MRVKMRTMIPAILHAVPVTDEGLSAGPIYPMNNSLLIGTKTSTSLGDVDPDLACPVPAYLHPSSILNCFGLCCDPLSFRKAVSIPEDHALLKVPSTLDLATQVFTSKVMSNSNAGTCFSCSQCCQPSSGGSCNVSRFGCAC